MPLPDFLALNFPSPTRVQQNSILIHPTHTSVDSASIASPNQQNQRQITVQRIGRDARPLLPCEIARYQHMFASNQSQRPEPSSQTRRSDGHNFVPDSRQERPENSRLRTLAQRIPRLNPISATISNGQSSSSSSSAGSADFRVIPWSERSRLQFDRSLDQDYVLRLPVLDLSRVAANRIANPASANAESTANHRLTLNNADFE